ncbi:unnamed protein product [Schistosoma margrebowiei]|uniref:Uncharacterized protein n=1 Tax=Schistosoma margrebowiei TaxID=48269 RepID=A0A183LTB5_9TREM|nr:unnamed protein product [Schistosoma margrebowiei]
MSVGDVLEQYETLKRVILKRKDYSEHQGLDQLFNDIDSQHGSATNILSRMIEVTGQRGHAQPAFPV